MLTTTIRFKFGSLGGFDIKCMDSRRLALWDHRWAMLKFVCRVVDLAQTGKSFSSRSWSGMAISQCWDGCCCSIEKSCQDDHQADHGPGAASGSLEGCNAWWRLALACASFNIGFGGRVQVDCRWGYKLIVSCTVHARSFILLLSLWGGAEARVREWSREGCRAAAVCSRQGGPSCLKRHMQPASLLTVFYVKQKNVNEQEWLQDSRPWRWQIALRSSMAKEGRNARDSGVALAWRVWKKTVLSVLIIWQGTTFNRRWKESVGVDLNFFMVIQK